MKGKIAFAALSIIVTLSNCNKMGFDNEYKFTNDYCATVVVGGIVGTDEKCFTKKEIVVAENVTDTSIFVRIAEHSERNDSLGPWYYQELLEVPKEHVKVCSKLF